MELKETIRIEAPRERVFAALNDPDILRQAIPGCEELEAAGEGEFNAVVSAKVGPLKARFKGQVALSDVVPPESYVLTGEGRGGPAGHAKVRASVHLDEVAGATALAYDVKADIGGRLKQLGGSIVQNTAEKLAGEFFRNFETLVAPPAAPGAAAEPPPATGEAPAVGADRLWLWIAGAAAALLLIAWLAL